ncbi:unnamed protein product [Discosporangium mesarthrocarpum]
MYPKDRVPHSNANAQMPPKLKALFTHVINGLGDRDCSPAVHKWEEVLDSSGSFSLDIDDWHTVEAFSVELQGLLATRRLHNLPNGKVEHIGETDCDSLAYLAPRAHATPSDAHQAPSHSQGRILKGKTRTMRAGALDSGTTDAATPVGEPDCTRRSVHRVTPKEVFRGSEPSAPLKSVPRLGPGCRRPGVPDGAVTSLASGQGPGPGAFETPSHSQVLGDLPTSPVSAEEPSPSRYPARVRSRRFPQLGGGGGMESSETSTRLRAGMGIEDVSSEGEHSPIATGRRGVSPSPFLAHSLPPGLGHSSGAGGGVRKAMRHMARQLDASCGGGNQGIPGGGARCEGGVPATVEDLNRDGGGGSGGGGRGGGGGGCTGYVMRTRGAPRSGRRGLAAAVVTPVGATMLVEGLARGPRSDPRPATNGPATGESAVSPPSPATSAAGNGSSEGGGGGGAAAVLVPREGGRFRLPPQNSRYVTRASVGGRNYTDGHLKQLGMIEAAVVGNASAGDHASFNLPRQGRTLTLTNIFKFVALRGAAGMYGLAQAKRVEEHTGRHSNFFDGKIDARVVGVIKRDIADEGITKSRKFSKILLSLIAEGCTDPKCDWDHTSFTSENITKLQVKLEKETGHSALQHFGDTPDTLGAGSGGGGGDGVGSSGSVGKRRLDLGRDVSQTPSPRLKKLKRVGRGRLAGADSTPMGAGIGTSR